MDIDIYYAGPNARQQYAAMAPVIKEAFHRTASAGQLWDWDKSSNTLKRKPAPKMNILISTAKDVDPSGEYKQHNWSTLMGCEREDTVESTKAEYYLFEMSRKFQTILRHAARHGFLSARAYDRFTLRDPFTAGDLVAGSVKQMFAQSNAAVYSADLQQLGPAATMIITLADVPGQRNTLQAYSRFTKDDLAPVAVSEKDIFTYVVGHEILGHSFYGHSVNMSKMDFTCAVLDYADLDRKMYDEAEADVAGAQFYTIARSMKLAEQVDIPELVEASRALGALYKNRNAYSIKNGKDIVYYMPTLKLDTTKPNFDSGLSRAIPKGVSALPILINTVADAIAGKLVVLNRKAEVTANPDAFNDTDKEVFKVDPAALKLLPHVYALYGYSARFGIKVDQEQTPFPRDTSMHVASIMYLKESGVLDQIAARLQPQLRTMLYDLVGDYLAGVEKIGSDVLKQKAQMHLAGLRTRVAPEMEAMPEILTQLTGIDVQGNPAEAEIQQSREANKLTKALPSYLFR